MGANTLITDSGNPPIVLHRASDVVPRLEFLDAVRGLASLWVLLFHVNKHVEQYIRIPEGVPRWAWFIKFGGIGVMLFFVVSAFSLCYSMKLHRDKSTTAFYIRRLFRIAPLFYVLLIFQLWRFPDQLQLAALLANVSFIFNFIPKFHESIVWGGWTIGVEMIFYLTFPFLFRCVDNIWKSAGLVIVSFLIAWVTTPLVLFYNLRASGYNMHAVFNFLPVFAAGILAFHTSEKFSYYAHRYAIGVIVTASALILLCLLLNSWGPSSDFMLFINRIALLEQGLIFGMFVTGLMFAPTAIFVNRVTTFLGKLSYSIYLTHLPVLILIIPLFRKIYSFPWSNSLQFVVCVAVTLCIVLPISYLTYRWIEEPGMRLGKLVWDRLSLRQKSSIVTG